MSGRSREELERWRDEHHKIMPLQTVSIAIENQAILPVAECLACGHRMPLAVWQAGVAYSGTRAGLCAPCRDAALHLRGHCSPERGCRCAAGEDKE